MKRKKACKYEKCGDSDNKPQQPMQLARVEPKISTINDVQDARLRRKLVMAVLCYIGQNTSNSFSKGPNRFLPELREMEQLIGHSLPFLEKESHVTYFGEAFGGVSDLYNGRHNMHENLMRAMQFFMGCPLRRGKRLLDFGTNVGAIPARLIDTLGLDAYGVDIDPFVISLGRYFGAKNIFVMENIGKKYVIPFENESFGTVLSSNTILSTIFDEQVLLNALLEIQRVLIPGGIFLLNPISSSDRLSNYPSIFKRIDCRPCADRKNECCDPNSVELWQKV